jgi:uncharacterized repeat protein (TIGR01451 family)
LLIIAMAVAGTMPLAGLTEIRIANAAPILFTESFTGQTSTGWIAGGDESACLTAGHVSGGIPACPPGTAGGATGTLPDPNGNGALRLTRNTTAQAGYAIYTLPIPTANGLDVTFDYYSYGGNGGDGLSFMLIDGSASPTSPGGMGGSLGYTPLIDPVNGVNQPGIAGGYLAVGLDSYGNFVNSLEGRDVGCPRTPYESLLVPDSVTIRGSAGLGGVISQTPSFEGYCHLATSGTLTDSLDITSSLRTSAGLRRVRIVLDINRILEVGIDFGSGYVPVIPPLNLGSISGQPALPSSVKLAFAAATGGRDNIHEVRNLVVRADRIGVRLSKVHMGDFVNGQIGSYRLSLTNNGSLATAPGASALITDTLPAGVTYVAGSCSGSGWVCNGAGSLVTASYSPGPAGVIPAESTLPPLTFSVNVNSPAAVVTNTSSGSMWFPTGFDTDQSVDMTHILGPDLAAEIAMAPSTPVAGQHVTFKANVSNQGTYTASGVSLSHTMSGPLTVVSVAASGGQVDWTCSAPPGIQCTAPALGISATAHMTVVALVHSSAISGTLVGSQVTAANAVTEIGSGSNAASVAAGVHTHWLSALPLIVRQ